MRGEKLRGDEIRDVGEIWVEVWGNKTRKVGEMRGRRCR